MVGQKKTQESQNKTQDTKKNSRRSWVFSSYLEFFLWTLEFFLAQSWFFETNIGLQSPGSLSGPVVASIRQRASQTSNFGGLEFFSYLEFFFGDSWVFFWSTMVFRNKYRITITRELVWASGSKYPAARLPDKQFRRPWVFFRILSFLCDSWVFFVESWDFFSPMATNGRYYEKHLFGTLGNLIRISYTKYPTSTHHKHVVFGFMAFLCILWGWVFPSVIVCFSQSQGKKWLGGQKIATKKTVDSD